MRLYSSKFLEETEKLDVKMIDATEKCKILSKKNWSLSSWSNYRPQRVLKDRLDECGLVLESLHLLDS